MNIVKVSDGMKDYLYTVVDNLATDDFIIGAARPFIRMAIENNFYKVNNILKLVADKNGDVDIEKLINETIASTLNSKKATYPIGEIGIVDFGDNAMKITIPAINKFFKFDSNDFIKMKDYIIQKHQHYEHL